MVLIPRWAFWPLLRITRKLGSLSPSGSFFGLQEAPGQMLSLAKAVTPVLGPSGLNCTLELDFTIGPQGTLKDLDLSRALRMGGVAGGEASLMCLPQTRSASLKQHRPFLGLLLLAVADERLGTRRSVWYELGGGTAAQRQARVPLGARDRPFQVGQFCDSLFFPVWSNQVRNGVSPPCWAPVLPHSCPYTGATLALRTLSRF